MKKDEQHKKVLSLRERLKEMSDRERETFEMMMKRDHDDEDLDTISLGELNRLHAKYVVKKSKNDLDAQWKKITGS